MSEEIIHISNHQRIRKSINEEGTKFHFEINRGNLIGMGNIEWEPEASFKQYQEFFKYLTTKLQL